MERQLAIVGEAVNHVVRVNKDLETSDKARIISFRNVIIHSYDQVETDIVWSVIHEKLPILEAEVKSYLNTIK